MWSATKVAEKEAGEVGVHALITADELVAEGEVVCEERTSRARG